jgi:hypothetical protein
MAKENSFTKMEVSMKEDGKKIRCTAEVFNL